MYDKLKELLTSQAHPLAVNRYVSFIVLRKAMDYLILRTEDDKSINTVQTPRSSKSGEYIDRVAFFASKQKAVERRQANRMYKNYNATISCNLKDNLCLSCPICILNGGIGTMSGSKNEFSIRSRVLYQTAYSLNEANELLTYRTFNATDEITQQTDQALNEIEMIKPNSIFLSVVTLLDPTIEEVKLFHAIYSQKLRYGAETRGIGIMENIIVGVAVGDYEQVTALDLVLTLNSQQSSDNELKKTLESILKEKIKGQLFTKVGTYSLSKDDWQMLEQNATAFVEIITGTSNKKKSKSGKSKTK